MPAVYGPPPPPVQGPPAPTLAQQILSTGAGTLAQVMQAREARDAAGAAEATAAREAAAAARLNAQLNQDNSRLSMPRWVVPAIVVTIAAIGIYAYTRRK